MSTVLVLSPRWVDSTQNLIERLKALDHKFKVLTVESLNSIPEQYHRFCLSEVEKGQLRLPSYFKLVLLMKPTIIHVVLPKLNFFQYQNIMALVFVLRFISNITFILTLDDLEFKSSKLLSLFDGVEVINKKFVPKIRKLKLMSSRQVMVPNSDPSQMRIPSQLQELVEAIGEFKLQVYFEYLILTPLGNGSRSHSIRKYSLSEMCYLIKVAHTVDFSSLADTSATTLFMVQLAKQHGKSIQLNLKQKVAWDYVNSDSMVWGDIMDHAANSLERIYRSSQLNASSRRI